MDGWLALIVAALGAIPFAWWYGEARKRRLTWRRDFIRAYRFPPGIVDKLRRKHANLSADQVRVVEGALRDFFLFYLRSGFRGVGMPSRVTDDLWHEFILDTRAYAAFCKEAFGHFFHHVPSGGLGQSKKKDAALRRTWHLACVAERMHPAKARKLPRLFALDAQLAVTGALVYSLHWPRSQEDDGCGGGACGGGGLASGDGSGCAGGGSGGGGCSGGGCGGGGCGGG